MRYLIEGTQPLYTTNRNAVDGTTNAQYIQNRFEIISGSAHLRDGIEKSVAKKVPGRKSVAIKPSIFIDALSVRVEVAISRLASVCFRVIRLNICA